MVMFLRYLFNYVCLESETKWYLSTFYVIIDTIDSIEIAK